MAFHTPGGGEIQLLAYKKHLPAHGVEVSLLDPWNPRFLDYDIVHFFSCIGGSSHFCRFVKQLGLPLVVSSSLWITEETKHLYPIDEIRVQLDLADSVISNSDIECDMLSKVLNLPRKKFFTVYNGVDEFFFEKTSPDIFRQQFGITDKFILNVGNIEPRKNQLKLAEAMCLLPGHKLVLIGHVRDTAYFQQIMEIGKDQVIFMGALPHDSLLLRSAYRASDVFCLPSTLETPGLAALEAAAQGIPMVVTCEGSTKEYFGNQSLYVNYNDAHDIFNAISTHLMNPRRPDEAKFKNFTWNQVTTALTQNYNNLLTVN